MQFSENWLRSLVGTDLDSQALSHALTMAGLEVEGMQQVAAPFTKVVVAKIISVEKHPDADKLKITTLDLGDGNPPVQIVCGASNVAVGQKVPVATIGTTLYTENGEDFKEMVMEFECLIEKFDEFRAQVLIQGLSKEIAR